MKISKELLKGSTTLLVLSMLEQQPMYGYQLIKRLELRSAGVFSLKEGTLYPILHALENDGQVEAVWSETEGRQRKTYHLTEKGRKGLQEKAAEWELFKGSIERVLGEV